MEKDPRGVLRLLLNKNEIKIPFGYCYKIFITVTILYFDDRYVNMKKIQFSLLICLIIIGLSSTGCISSKNLENNSTTLQQTFLPRTSFPTPPTHQPNYIMSEHIIINPVAMHYVGEVFEINGTTDFSPDEKIKVSIFPGPHSVASTGSLEKNVFVDGYAVIKPGPSGKNTWSFLVNTTGFPERSTLIWPRSEKNTTTNSTTFYLCGNISRKSNCENCSHGKACW